MYFNGHMKEQDDLRLRELLKSKMGEAEGVEERLR
jgi:hypothetical protein